jgi:hypothetical protein
MVLLLMSSLSPPEAVELGGEHNELPRHNAPDMVAAIREGVTEQLKRRNT